MRTQSSSGSSRDVVEEARKTIIQEDTSEHATRRHLQEAAETGNITVTKELLARSPKHFVNNVDANGSTLLFSACWYGHLDLIKVLLEEDAKINLSNFRNNRPIHMAIEQNQCEVVKFLLAQGAKCTEEEVAEIRKRTGKKISKRMEKLFPKIEDGGPTLKELQAGLKNFSKNADMWDDFFTNIRSSRSEKEDSPNARVIQKALEDENHYLHDIRRTPLKERSLYAQNLKKQISEHPESLYGNHNTSSKNLDARWAKTPEVLSLAVRLENIIAPKKRRKTCRIAAKTLCSLQRGIRFARVLRQDSRKDSRKINTPVTRTKKKTRCLSLHPLKETKIKFQEP